MLLISPRAARTPSVVEALLPLVNAILDERMRAANRGVDIDERPPGDVAADLFAEVRKARGEAVPK